MDDHDYMDMALDLALKVQGFTSPNPMVGAVVVKNGKVVGTGYHQAAGKAHAEVNALNDAGGDANGATLYVNLEPCNHTGRTPFWDTNNEHHVSGRLNARSGHQRGSMRSHNYGDNRLPIYR